MTDGGVDRAGQTSIICPALLTGTTVTGGATCRPERAPSLERDNAKAPKVSPKTQL